MKVKKLIAFSLIVMVLFVVFLVISSPSAQASSKVYMSAVRISTIRNQKYTGNYIKPDITVKYSGRTLKKGTDYTVSYSNNKEIGTARVTVTGKGIYYRNKNCYF